MNYTNEDKQLLLDNTAVTYSRISLLDENGNVIEVFTENDKLVEWHFEDYRYVPDNGFIGQFVERLLDGTLTDIGDDVILDGKEILLELGIRGQGSEDINYYEYGNFMITSVSKEDTTGNYKFESCDYTKKFNTEFNGEREYPCTALALLNMACDQAGVSLKDNGSAITYAVPTEGLEVGNYNFKYEYQGEEQVVTTYYNFSITEKLNYGDSLMLIINDNKLIERRVNEDYSITRNNLSFVTGSTGTGTLLSDEILDYVDFVNNDFVVEDNQFVESNSCRDVVKEVAKLGYTWARIDENNELCLDFSKKTEDDISTYNTIDTDLYYEAKVTGETVKPVNKVLLGMSTVDGENIVKGQNADEMSLDTIYGDTSQDTLTGKNMFNKNQNPVNTYAGYSISVLDTGVKLIYTSSTQQDWAFCNWVLFDLTNYTGKTIRFKTNFTNNGGRGQYTIGRSNSDASSRVTMTGVAGNSGTLLSFVVPTIPEGDDRKYLCIWLYANTQGSISQGSYVEYKDVILTVDNNDMSYEPYCGGTPSPNPDYQQEMHNVSGDNVIKDVGKNFANIYLGGLKKGDSRTVNGITYTINNDGTISGSGTATANSNFILFGAWDSDTTLLPIDRNKTYYISNNSEKDGNVDIGCFYTRVARYNNGTLQYSSVGNNTSFAGWDYINLIMLSVANGQTVNFTNKWYQLEEGNQPTNYEPYQEKKYKISLPVENKLNKDGGFTLQGMNTQGGLVSNNTNALFNGYIDVLPNTSYTLSTNAQVATLTIAEYNGTTFVVRKQANNVSSNTITTGSSTNKVRVIISKDSSTTMTQEIIDSLLPRLEKGTKANTYVPYGLVPIGENLFDYDSNNNELNGWFNENNTVISLSSNTRTIYMPCKPNKTYTISRIKGARFFVGYATEKPANGVRTYGVIGGANIGTYLTITTGNNAKYLAAFVYISTADTLSYEQIKKSVRIEEGSISHFDDRVIELNKIGDYKDEIFRTNKRNLLNSFIYETVTHSGCNINIDENGIYVIPSSSTPYIGTALKYPQYVNDNNKPSLIEVKPSTVYTFSVDNTRTSYLTYVDENYQAINTADIPLNNLTKYTFTTPSNCKYVAFRLGASTSTPFRFDYLMLNEGNGALPFEPYNSSGDWYWKRPIGRLILNGSESNYGTLSNGQGGQKRFRYSTDIIANVPNDILTVYCNIWKGVIYNDNNKSDNQISQWSADNMLCITTNSTTMTLGQFKEELSNNNPLIYFILSKTQYNKITYTPLINQLNAIQNDSLLEGTNHITIEPNDLTPTIDISVRDIDQEITNYSGKTIDLTAKHYEESEIQLFDNPLTHSERLRRIAINGCETLFGLTYTPMEIDSIGHPWMYGDDYCKITNLNNSDYFFYPFNRSIDYKGYIEGKLESVSEGKIEQKYEWDSGLLSKIRQTEINVDKANGNITLLTKTTQDIQSDIEQNYYTKEMTNTLIQNAETGVTNTFSEAGGNNIFRNTGLWFAQSDSNNPYEFWTGNVVRSSHDKASNGYCLLLQNTTLSQDELVANGDYTVSFKYRKISPLAVAKCVINGVEYILDSQTDTEFQQTGTVNSQHIKIDFICNTDNGCEIYDIMVNAGKVKLAYSQNQNETITDTVNISKGITITSTSTDTTFKANADGIRLLNKGGDVKTKFTDSGTETDSIVVNEQSIIVGILRQRVGDQVWDAMV